jgi:hypothetical protein
LIQFDKSASFFKSCVEAVTHYLIEKEIISLRLMIMEDQMATMLNSPDRVFQELLTLNKAVVMYIDQFSGVYIVLVFANCAAFIFYRVGAGRHEPLKNPKNQKRPKKHVSAYMRTISRGQLKR